MFSRRLPLTAEARLNALRVAIAAGKAEIHRGEFAQWTPGFMDRLRSEAEDEERFGAPMGDEALP